jgi:hypothetical protein
LQTVFAADAHPEEGQLLCEKTSINKGKIYNVKNRNANASNYMQGRTKFKTAININKKMARLSGVFYRARSWTLVDLKLSHNYKGFLERNVSDTKPKTFAEYAEAFLRQ